MFTESSQSLARPEEKLQKPIVQAEKKIQTQRSDYNAHQYK